MDRVAQWLISTEQLEEQLGSENLRIFDCSTRLVPDPEDGFRVEACLDDWKAGHIPGSGFIDIQNKLSKPDPKLRFTFPEPEAFAAAMQDLGVSDDSRVVLYSRFHPMWATRVWYQMRAMGFDNVAVLDGGIDKWQAEGRAISTTPPSYPKGSFTAHLRPGMIVDKDEVRAAIETDGIAIVNALTAELHKGEVDHYGRPGRIAGSELVSARAMIDPKTKAFKPLPELQQMLDAAGADGQKPVITYCGGGIAATTPAFIMALLGRDQVALYDNSLTEWCALPELPMEVG